MNPSSGGDTPIIRTVDLYKKFPQARFFSGERDCLHAVNGVNFRVAEGETLGLVGESGCGKSTVGNLLLRLLKPDGGRIFYKGRDLRDMAGKRRLLPELAKIQAVFQDPQSSLDPRMNVERLVGSPLLPYSGLSKAQRAERVRAILREVGMWEEHLDRFPHEFSGGQRQRVSIARSLIVEPEFIVFDEPTSALDVSVQAQILNLIKDLQTRHGYAYLFISHDLAVIRHVSRRVAVMYLGRIVESALRDDLFLQPRHPYTRALMDSVPEPDPDRRKPLAVLQGDVPSPVRLPGGCSFHPRCPEAAAVCSRERPRPARVNTEHFVECWMRPV
jgi:peptide/nickel transport system ATP-binding protein/oligopeptide transport system ATP-binding protein